MHRPRRFWLMAAVLTVIYIAIVMGIWYLPRAIPTDHFPATEIPAAAVLIIYLLLTRHIWGWLRRHLERVPDLPIFLMVLFTVFYLAAVFIFWILPGSPQEKITRRFLLIPLLAVFLFIWLIANISDWQNIRRESVKGREVAVVQRNNIFHALADPGTIWLFNRHRIAYTINTALQTKRIMTEILRMHDLAYKYTLDIRYRLSPQILDQVNGDSLQSLSPAYSSDRRIHKREIIQKAFHHATAHYQAQQSHAPHKTPFDALLLVIPGMPASDDILKNVAAEVADELKKLGIELDSIIIQEFHISRELKEELNQAYIRQLLRERDLEQNETLTARVLEWVGKAGELQVSQAQRGGRREESLASSEQSTGDAEKSSIDPDYALIARDLSIMKIVPDMPDAPESDSTQAMPGSPNPPRYFLSPHDLNIMQTISG